MERLSIKEIIDHCNRKVIWWEKLIPREKFENRDTNDSACKEYWEHRQVAEYLNELQQYRATGLSPEQIEIMKGHNETLLRDSEDYLLIGSVEECREAVEKMKPKKVQKIQIPNTSWTKAQTRFECPSCHKYLNYRELSHCGLCGQRLLWEE